MVCKDFDGRELSIGEDVAVCTAPMHLQRGIITDIRPDRWGPTLQVVITQQDGQTVTVSAQPFVVAALRKQ